ncbi:conserved Plasmodium protein, unknown function [Plasmodium relictum]|uniref:Uncharacterized protein n=1 Tax=Plasmodium relictum TaxID=85471 RepID=A0A1J1HDI1_PLARL|nr:conserved Plasmodium protein, unknown function [Plasmodium relictum]CRH01643.1 conserved Plasmodium protein, unknown function [Plasmodium relictum]
MTTNRSEYINKKYDEIYNFNTINEDKNIKLQNIKKNFVCVNISNKKYIYLYENNEKIINSNSEKISKKTICESKTDKSIENYYKKKFFKNTFLKYNSMKIKKNSKISNYLIRQENNLSLKNKVSNVKICGKYNNYNYNYEMYLRINKIRKKLNHSKHMKLFSKYNKNDKKNIDKILKKLKDGKKKNKKNIRNKAKFPQKNPLIKYKCNERNINKNKYDICNIEKELSIVNNDKNNLNKPIRITNKSSNKNFRKIILDLNCKDMKKSFFLDENICFLRCQIKKKIKKLKELLLKKNIEYYINRKHDEFDKYSCNIIKDIRNNNEIYIKNEGENKKKSDLNIIFKRKIKNCINNYLNMKLLKKKNVKNYKSKKKKKKKYNNNFIIHIIFDSIHTNSINYYSYVKNYVRKFFHYYFHILYKKVLNYYTSIYSKEYLNYISDKKKNYYDNSINDSEYYHHNFINCNNINIDMIYNGISEQTEKKCFILNNKSNIEEKIHFGDAQFCLLSEIDKNKNKNNIYSHNSIKNKEIINIINIYNKRFADQYINNHYFNCKGKEVINVNENANKIDSFNYNNANDIDNNISFNNKNTNDMNNNKDDNNNDNNNKDDNNNNKDDNNNNNKDDNNNNISNIRNDNKNGVNNKNNNDFIKNNINDHNLISDINTNNHAYENNIIIYDEESNIRGNDNIIKENNNDNDKGTIACNNGNNNISNNNASSSNINNNTNEHENYYKLIKEMEILEKNENMKESSDKKRNKIIDTIINEENKMKLLDVEKLNMKSESLITEKDSSNLKIDKLANDENHILNINQNIIHTSNYINQPLKLPLLPEMSHPNSFSPSHSPRSNNLCSSNKNSTPKNSSNQLNDPDFEEACDIRLMNSLENMKFSQSPPTSSLHASCLHLTDVNELVLSPNQQLYSNSPLKSPNTPLTPTSSNFESNSNEENLEKVNSNYLISSPYRNDIFSEFDMLSSFFESLDDLENKSDCTESSSNENSKYGNNFSLDIYGNKIKKGNIQKDEVIYNFKKDNSKKVFHAWCNKGKHELNYDNKKFNSVMEWINYIEELMSHEEGADKSKDENVNINVTQDFFCDQNNYNNDNSTDINNNNYVKINKDNDNNNDMFMSNNYSSNYDNNISNNDYNNLNMEKNNNENYSEDNINKEKKFNNDDGDHLNENSSEFLHSLNNPSFNNVDIINFESKQNLIPEYNNAEDHVTYSNEINKNEDYFQDLSLNNKNTLNDPCNSFIWNDDMNEKDDYNYDTNFSNINNKDNDFDINAVEQKNDKTEENANDNVTPSNFIEVTDPWKRQ